MADVDYISEFLDTSSKGIKYKSSISISEQKGQIYKTLKNFNFSPLDRSDSQSQLLSNSFPSSKSTALASLRRENKHIVINVGGVRFETYKSTLKLISESRLANLSPTNSDFDTVRNEYFFDRDPCSFQAILNYFRTGTLHAPNTVCGNRFYEELIFWGIDERCIQPCCWTDYSAKRECNKILKKVMHGYEDEDFYQQLINNEKPDSNDMDQVPTFHHVTKDEGIAVFPRVQKKRTLHQRIFFKFRLLQPAVWRFMENRSTSLSAKIYFWVSVAFLVISLLSYVLETLPNNRIPHSIAANRSMTRRERHLLTTPHPVFFYIELVCNIFFTVEFLLRFTSSPSKKGFSRNPYNFLQFLALTPLFWPTFREIDLHNYIQVVYILRVLRIFSLVPKYSAIRVLLLTLKHSIRELVLYIVMLSMTIMLFGACIYYAEQIYETAENKIDSIPLGLWWAVVTMTTLGYGDFVPTTTVGYLVGAACAVSGLIFTALPIPIIVNNFALFYSHAKATRQLKSFSDSAEQKSLLGKVKARQLKTEDNHEMMIEDSDGEEDMMRGFEFQEREENFESLIVENKKEKRKVLSDSKTLEKWKLCKRRRQRRMALINI